ncbi:MAG: phosphate/phosphite/phosphonate ABC transporter substrate-binding protein [Bdellovibrionaceae bacterium]|nr:phosphate/phosphite/phosphonate ABC transporter substrate-binding protein [Pseudobdellovibrionaceae bacterium]MBX3032490.1 phosphate/phosphite/phosphonate ABC transporter substrate-binding protein [Pseudobdellovibrionaceae bacterium]
MPSRTSLVLIAAIFVAWAMTGCVKKAELGTENNPVKLFFVPSVDAKVLETNAEVFKKYLEQATGYQFEVSIPQSYIAVVESFGTKRADVAAINTFGYIKAHEKYGAEARLTVIRHGLATYQSQFLAKADSPIKTLKDLDGKKVAFVDPASASGYLLPMKSLKERQIKPKETVFAMKHDAVVSMIYQGQVDAGATFYSPPSDKGIEDARRLVMTQYPDIEKRIKIVELSDAIPNDPIIFRKEMPEEMKNKIVEAFVAFVATPEGKVAFKEIYSVDELKKATDKDYDEVRAMLTSLGTSVDDLMKK